jgi:hypothetical protein
MPEHDPWVGFGDECPELVAAFNKCREYHCECGGINSCKLREKMYACHHCGLPLDEALVTIEDLTVFTGTS